MEMLEIRKKKVWRPILGGKRTIDRKIKKMYECLSITTTILKGAKDEVTLICDKNGK